VSFAIVIIAEENITDCSLEHDPKHPGGIDVIELLEKSMLPERFTQPPNATIPSVLSDIGANNSNPEGLLHPAKAELPIDVSLEEKDATSLWQFSNAFAPMVVNGIALLFVMVMRFEHPLNASLPIVASRLEGLRDTRMRLVRF